MQRYQSIQVLRALAVIAVIFFHFSNFTLGRAGVDLFFCISGFVMAGQMERSPGRFALDRFTRIYPPFLAALAIFILASGSSVDAAELSRSLLLWPDQHQIYLYPGWSLGYEAIFYTACIGAILVGGRTMIALFIALFLLRVPYFGSPFLLEFLAGFCIARRAWLALPVLLFAAAVDNRVLTYGAPAALLLWYAVTKESWFQHRWWRPAAAIGDASYAIYLTHVSVGFALPSNAPLLLVIWLCLAAGFAFHLAVEKPLVKFGRLASGKLLAPKQECSPGNTQLGHPAQACPLPIVVAERR